MDAIVKIEVILAAAFEISFFVLFIQTKWHKKELGPYIFRKQLGFVIIIGFALLAVFVPSLSRTWLRPLLWLLVVFIFGEQLLRLIMDKYKASRIQKK